MSAKAAPKNEALRAIPSVDSLLRTKTGKGLEPVIGTDRLTVLARQVTESLRAEISDGSASEYGRQKHSRALLLEEAERRLTSLYQQDNASRLGRLINATGVVLHTNLGRASLSKAARSAIQEASGYCNLEYDVTTGMRGRRGARAEQLISQLTGAESGLIVNNCAAAALLVLTTFAKDGEAIVSRGELVEIGGDFRVPEVMAQSGTNMIEVGTTNRTKLSDYAKAISGRTRLLMRVHTSNYRIVGFTKAPAANELADLAHEHQLILYEDAGSGALIDVTGYRIADEPVIADSVAAGADIVSFSGDKLLGGPQAGFLVGRSPVIDRLRRHPLYRALRVDKLRLAAIEATLEAYARNIAAREVPALAAISCSKDEIRKRATAFVNRLDQARGILRLEILEGSSAVGGGAAPTAELPTALISITHPDKTANQIEAQLRGSTPPVIARIENDRVVLDLRTVADSEEPELQNAVLSLF